MLCLGNAFRSIKPLVFQLQSSTLNSYKFPSVMHTSLAVDWLPTTPSSSTFRNLVCGRIRWSSYNDPLDEAPPLFSKVSKVVIKVHNRKFSRNVSAHFKASARVEEEQDEEDIGSDRDNVIERKSKAQSKRESLRARQWAVALVGLAPAQLRQAIRWGSLPDELYDAVILVQSLGNSSRVRNGRRRQVNFIGGLIRDIDSDLMESVLKATRDGDLSGLMISSAPLPVTQEDTAASDVVSEEDGIAKKLAEQWMDGLIRGVPSVENDVYSLYSVEYDHQELRELVQDARRYLVRQAKSALPVESSCSAPGLYDDNRCDKARRVLLHFLIDIAKHSRVEVLL